MRPRLLILRQLVLASALITPLHAADEIQDAVPLDLVKALLANNSPFDIRLYSGIPDHFPEILIPDSVELLGSADMGHSQQIVMRAEGDGLQQRFQIMNSLENQGYLLLTQAPGANMAQTGFVTPRLIPPGMPVQLCHDVHGMLIIRVTGTNPLSAGFAQGGPALTPQVTPPTVFSPFFNATPDIASGRATSTNSIINVTISGGINNPRSAMMGGVNCVQIQAQHMGRAQGGAMMTMTNLNQYMPRMELPAAATLPAMGMGMGPQFSSSSAARTESRIDMSIDWELGTLFRHLADQIGQQKWQTDNETVGSISANASWTREVDDLKLLGSLRVVNTADSQYHLLFSIQSVQTQ
jgi:hypothetical protein